MYPAPIEDYQRPRTLAEAVAAVQDCEPGDTVFMAGGQSLMQAIKSRIVRPRCIVDLQGIPELRGIAAGAPGAPLRIGAMTRYVEIATSQELGVAHAALRDAAQHVGDRQVRNRGTIGGSCCWNYVASCMPAVSLGLGGTLHLVGAGGASREILADDFLIAPLETARRDDELLVALSFPHAPRSGSAYRKWGLVTDALPVVGACVQVVLDAAGRCTAARVALSGLAAGAQRVPVAEQLLYGTTGEAAALGSAFDAAAGAVEAQSDKWAEADYRRQLIRTLGAEVATLAFQRARGAA